MVVIFQSDNVKSVNSVSFIAAIEAAISETPVELTPKYSGASDFLKASASFSLKASQAPFSFAMSSASDGAAADFISPLFVLAVMLLLPVGSVVHAAATINIDTSTRIFFIFTTPLAESQKCVVLLCQKPGTVKSRLATPTIRAPTRTP